MPFRDRSTVIWKPLQPWEIRVKGQMPPFFRSQVFCLEDSTSESSLKPTIPPGAPFLVLLKKKRSGSGSLDFQRTAPWCPLCLPLSYHLRWVPVPPEAGKHIPRQCGPKLTKAAPAAAHLAASLPSIGLKWEWLFIGRFISENYFNGSIKQPGMSFGEGQINVIFTLRSLET